MDTNQFLNMFKNNKIDSIKVMENNLMSDINIINYLDKLREIQIFNFFMNLNKINKIEFIKQARMLSCLQLR